MKCRICGKDIDNIQNISNVKLDVNSVYKNPVKKFGIDMIYGFCNDCKHGQFENKLLQTHYTKYNLLNIDTLQVNDGGNANLRENYYMEVVSRLQSSECVIDAEKLLDIGCGHGTIMKYAMKYFHNVLGIEPSTVECEIARKNGCNVINSYFDDTCEEGFSAFIMTQVLEHLDNLIETVKNAYRILKIGGGGILMFLMVIKYIKKVNIMMFTWNI